MIVRLFDWHDLPLLLKYRHRVHFFDNALVLTRGAALVSAGALLSYFAPATGIFTFLCTDRDERKHPLIGQVMHVNGQPFARLVFLAPESALDSDAFPRLIEQMLVHLGERGALHLLVEVDEQAAAFEILRKMSFAIYARQRVWRLTGERLTRVYHTPWQRPSVQDESAVRALYHNLVPGMVQQLEPLPKYSLDGLVYIQDDKALAYAEVKTGMHGIWIQPFVDLEVENVAGRIADLIHTLDNRGAKPVFICVRSYQSWLELALEDLGADPGPSQAVMVKHLAVSQKIAQTFALKSLEGRQPEVSAPIANRSMSNNI